MYTLTKLCADHLRAFTNANYGVTLKSSHAHEIVAAFLGYQSRAALLTDTKHSLDNLREASIIVLSPTDPINQRRETLHALPPGLPDTYALTEGVYGGLISEKWILGKIWPTFGTLAIFLADEYLREKKVGNFYRRPVREGVKIDYEDNHVHLKVFRFYQIVSGNVVHQENITTKITLQRVAGHIGYNKENISIETEKLETLQWH